MEQSSETKMVRSRGWWASWLNRGLVAAFGIILIAYLLVELLWTIPNSGESLMGGNVGSTGRFIVQFLAALAAFAVLLLWFFLKYVAYYISKYKERRMKST